MIDNALPKYYNNTIENAKIEKKSLITTRESDFFSRQMHNFFCIFALVSDCIFVMGHLFKKMFFLVLIAISGFQMALSQVYFSNPGGFYEHSFSLTMTSGNGTIHYTLDGSVPTTQSATYFSPLFLSPELYSTRNIFLQQNAPADWWNPPTRVNHVIVLRAAAFDDLGKQIGEECVNTYFISDLTGYAPRLPLLSITIDPDALFASDSGIFSPDGWTADDEYSTGNFNQHGQEWEKIANIEFYELNGGGFAQRLGVRIHGGKTRQYMQKPFKLYARKEYGQKNINYPVFNTRSYSTFKRLVLKPFCASWTEDGLSDYLAQNIAAPLRFVSLASRPVTVYINGEYWGIYYLQEAPDERLVAQIDDVDADDVNLIGSWEGFEENGSNAGFYQLMDFLNNADLSDSLQYLYLCSLIDIDNFIDYQLFEAFIANKDWPANNMRCFQHYASLWRWIFYDGDAAFSDPDYDMSTLMTYNGKDSYPSNSISTLCFRMLLQSPLFLKRFYARMMELNATTFNYDNNAPLLCSAIAEIQFEVNRQSERFNMPSNISEWENATMNIDNFLRNRTSAFESQMTELLSVPSDASVSFLLYPNPVHDVCNIRCTDNISGVVQYEIFDCMGRRVLRDIIIVSEQCPETINISSLPTGVYIVYFPSLGNAYQLVIR